jgi:hypothetical protein
MGVAGRDIQYGYGLVNAKRAVDLAAAYAASRTPCTVNRETDGDGGKTVLVRRGAGVPSWIEQADVFDGSGRLVQTSELDMKPGTYFIRAGTIDHGQSPAFGVRRSAFGVTYKLLVLN